jgi:hypothetical protein
MVRQLPRLARLCALVAAGLAAPAAFAGDCRLDSPAHRVTVIELYTSEGCSSCPPADRWFSGLPQAGVSAEHAVLLAYHVDYWNPLGWPDRFSQAQFSERQRTVAARNRASFIYTPQVVVDGRDFRRWRGGVRDELAAINHQPARATIRAAIEGADRQWRLRGEAALAANAGDGRAQAWIAVFENGLSTEVRAGENAGARLAHDRVVRELAGPFAIGADGRATLDHRITLKPGWNAGRIGIAVFVERSDSGEILEAAARYPLCES